MNTINDKFKNGSKWIRFDCHLHTKSDKQFQYKEDENYYNSAYVKKLKEENISVGVITNHNKFNLEEFKAIKKTAKKENIFIMPGIELSVNDGINGIHILIVFNSEQWLEKENNYIQQFISETFAGKHNFENEDGRSNDNLITTIEKLNKYQRGYFIILAHVEDKSGFFKALDGGRISELSKNKLFRNSVIGFQKVRTRDEVTKWKQWLDNVLPAFVEGSDPKRIEEIGKGKKTYIKIGDYNFEAVKFALQNQDYRVSNDEEPKIENAYIKSVSFEGGKLDGKTIDFSSSMNSLIGIRGSGKSSIIEAIRYGLGIEINEKNIDYRYKNNLVKELLGSGGKITIKALDNRSNEYEIQRVYGQSLEIKKDGEIKKFEVFEHFNKPLYFGQKDLSSYKDGYENDLIKKFIGGITKDINEKIELKQQEIKILLQNSKKYQNLDNKKDEIVKKIEGLKEKIEDFKKYNIEEKLKKQIEFNKDEANFSKIIDELKEFKSEIDSFVKNYKDGSFFESLKKYSSKENSDIFDNLYKIIDKSKVNFLGVFERLEKSTENFKEINPIYKDFKERYKNFNEEFLKIQREINLPDNLRADDFIKYTKTLNTHELMLKEIDKQTNIKNGLSQKLLNLLSELNNLYLEEYRIIENEINSINQNNSSIKLKATYKGRCDLFEQFLRNIFGGSGLSKVDYETLTTTYPDGIEIYKNIENITFGGNKLLIFKERFEENLSTILTYKVENKIEILYNEQLLQNHSLGQRASALIIFILTQRDNDIIIIDQPEDDLDNQTIYNEVIKELLKLKSKTQFIFATHNANIPVLGDCEQVVVCNYKDDKIDIEYGSIDKHIIQDKIINIMEGGEEAFDKRKDIYNLWKH